MTSLQTLTLPIALILLCGAALAHVKLDSPNGGEVVTVGSTLEIQWHVSVAHNTLNWDLWYSTKGSDGPWIPLATDLPPGDISDGAAHEYIWRIPVGLAGKMHIRIRQDNTGEDYYDSSENGFTVAPAPASYTNFGSGCSGSAGVPTLSQGSAGTPKLAEQFEVELGGLPASGTGAFIVIGFSRTAATDLNSVGMPGCSSYLSVDLALPLSTSLGSATWSFAIPNDLGLIGLHFYNQAVVLDSGAGNPLGAVVTNAAAGLIGAR